MRIFFLKKLKCIIFNFRYSINDIYEYDFHLLKCCIYIVTPFYLAIAMPYDPIN